jgi:glycerophosphoryl diester phosphodiesterase
VVDETLVAAAHERGVAVHVWTINDETTMERLVDLGVDGIISDRPRVLAALLESRGVSWSGIA